MTFSDLLYKAWAALYNNKQSWLGSIVAGIAFIQANPALKSLMSATTYEWLMFGLGLLMVLFARSAAGGSVASHVLPANIPPARTKESGFIRPAMLGIMLALGSVSAGFIAACTHTQEAYKAADTFTDQVFVVLSHYESLQDEAIRILESPSGVDPAVAKAIRDADAAGTPVMNELREAEAAWLAIKDAKTEADLQAALDNAVRKLAELLRANKRGRVPT